MANTKIKIYMTGKDNNYKDIENNNLMKKEERNDA